MSETGGRRKTHKARGKSGPAYSPSAPQLAPSVEVLFRTTNRSVLSQYELQSGDRIVTSRIIYKPGIFASARISFHGTRWNLHQESEITKIVAFPQKHQICQWEEDLNSDWSSQDARPDPEPSSFFMPAGDYDFSQEHFDELQEEFIQYLITTETLTVEYNPIFKLDRKFDEAEDNFSNRCLEKAREEFNQEMHQMEDTLQRLSDRLKQRLDREVREGKDPGEVSRYSTEFDIQEEIVAHDAKKTLEDIRKEMQELDQLRESKMKEFVRRLESVAGERETETFRLNRPSVNVLQFRLVWLPYQEYILQEEDSRRVEMIQAF
jgi:hypothetical protein